MDGFNDVVDGDPTNVLTTGTDTAGANTSDALVLTGADSNGDGAPNSFPSDDTDGDGILDHLDLDADNDGIADVVEAGGTDENGDGIADGFVDADNDGFNDVVDGDPTNALTTGTDTAGANTTDALLLTGADSDGDGSPNSFPSDDTDGDGILDHLDLDADNDGIPDVVEAGGTDENGDGKADAYVDGDGDGFNDVVDGDPTNALTTGTDTVGANTTDALVLTGADSDGDGTPNSFPGDDTDGDGILDHLDLDADNDGIPDVVEAGGTDTNGDGIADGFVDADMDGFNDIVDGDPTNALATGTDTAGANTSDALILTGADSDGNGVPNSYPADDTDGDGILDHLDLDGDNDGIPDVVEAGGTDENGDGIADGFVDADGDGFNDVVDGDPTNALTTGTDTAGANTTDALVLTGADSDGDGAPNSFPADDTDGDGILDHLDLDVDNDGIADVVEAGGTDVNGDGIADGFVDADNDGFNDVVDGDPTNALTTGTDTAGANTTDALVLTGADSDGDGAPNSFPGDDTDGDGILDHLDLDADNDGIPDVVEAGGTDVNGDGKADAYVDGDGDGFNDVIDGDPTNALTSGTDTPGTNTTDALVLTGADMDGDGAPNSYPTDDTDGDGLLDHLDLDADNDGIPDVVEAGGIDTDGNGLADAYVDADMDGFNDVVDGDPTNVLPTGTDTPGANTANALVLTGADTNADGQPNSYPTDDTDGDGNLDHLDLDADNDGIPDLVEAGGIDTDGDGQVDTATDVDQDGLADIYDENASNGPGGNGTNGIALVETNVSGAMVAGDDGTEFLDKDGDNLPDHLDLDADNDGIPDVIEAGGNDPEGDGMVDTTTGWDADGDGLADIFDTNDNTVTGTADGSGSALIQTNADTDGDATVNVPAEMMVSGGGGSLPINPDGDAIPNHLDIDADNDGIMDVTEAGATDSNNDGMVDDGAGAFVDTDGDGFADGVDGNVGNDGTLEGSNPLITTGTDDAGDTDTRLEYAGNGLSDSDGDAVPDYLDLDADADNIPDMQEAWDNLIDGDSQCDNVSSCANVDADGDGLIDCFDNNDANPSDYTWAGNPANDTDGASGAAAGTVFTSDLDVILPDNIGNDATQPDYRDNLNACVSAKVFYGVTEKSAGTLTDYEFDGSVHVDDDGSTQIVRATVYCEPDADGWYYYYNPLEPENYLFAIKNSAASPNTVAMWDIVDYIEIKVEPTATDRHKVGAAEASFVMERDWNVVFKGTPTVGSTFDVKFYFQPGEMDALDAAADAVEAQATGTVTRTFQWMKKSGGVTNTDISTSGVASMTDITSNDQDGINEASSDQTDNVSGSVGNEKNYVEFKGLTSFSGGTALIKLQYSALPVELSRFVATPQGCNVNIDWSSASEERFSHYEIERSLNGTDYEMVSRVSSRGGVQEQHYHYLDKEALPKGYYRLKMVDLDGSFEYSHILQVTTDCSKEFDIIIYPNPVPARHAISVKFFAESAEAKIQLTDMFGRVLKVLPFSNLEREWTTTIIDLNNLPAGSYYLHIDAQGDRTSKGFMILE